MAVTVIYPGGSDSFNDGANAGNDDETWTYELHPSGALLLHVRRTKGSTSMDFVDRAFGPAGWVSVQGDRYEPKSPEPFAAYG